MNLEECFEKRLLRNAPPDRLKSEKAIEMAQRAIMEAEKLFGHRFYEQVILYSYTAMFQGARALLFKDGFVEKSHYCVVEYLKRHYVRIGKLDQSHIHWLDTYRIERHETLLSKFSAPVRPSRIPHAPGLPAGGLGYGRGWESRYRD